MQSGGSQSPEQPLCWQHYGAAGQPVCTHASRVCLSPLGFMLRACTVQHTLACRSRGSLMRKFAEKRRPGQTAVQHAEPPGLDVYCHLAPKYEALHIAVLRLQDHTNINAEQPVQQQRASAVHTA
jgi:hypothetical protein